jgi:hypothetical protein
MGGRTRQHQRQFPARRLPRSTVCRCVIAYTYAHCGSDGNPNGYGYSHTHSDRDADTRWYHADSVGA